MKKTTWVIIGLSICVVVLSTVLGVVLLQKKTETIIVREFNPDTSNALFNKPWPEFTLAPRPIDAINPDRINSKSGINKRYVIVGSMKSVTYSIKKEDENR